MFLKKIIILAMCLYCYRQVPAQQQWRFISYNVGDGLSQNSVHCFYQDRDGLLWLGTQDGLNSFDGHNFKTYKYSSSDTTSISDQFVLSIEEDTNGYLWIATRSGINKLNKRTGKFSRYYFSEAEKNTIARSFQRFSKNSAGEIFINHNKYPSFVNKKSEIVRADTGLTTFRSCSFDSKDRLWSFNSDGELFFAEKNNNYHPEKKSDAPVPIGSSRFIQCVVDTRNILWCYDHEIRSHLFFYDIDAGKWTGSIIALPSMINQVNITAEGTGWISTMSGIYIVRNYRLEELIGYDKNNVEGLSPGGVLCSYEDRQGNIWVGTSSAGFAYYNPAFDNFRLRSTGTLNDAVTAVVKNHDVTWIGAASGLYRVDEGNSKHFFLNKRISGLSKDKSGNIWVAVQNEGLYILNQNGNIERSFIRDDSLLQTKKILYLFCDSKGRTILCTEWGFFVYDPATKKWISFYQLRSDRSPSGWYVLHAYEDRRKNIWLSKNHGIEVLNEDLHTVFHIESAEATSTISRTLITATTADKNGVIWIATLSNGIYRYDNKKLEQFTVNQGLSSNVIYGIVCDEKGRLWATTTSGMNIYDPGENRFSTLTSKDGLPADDFVLGALVKDDEEKILAGSSKGLIEIDAAKIRLHQRIAVARISEVRLNGETIETTDNSLVVEPGNKTIGFEFSLKQALQPRNIIYQYKMKGDEEMWNMLVPGNARITYSNLPFGKLTMQVRAAYSANDLEAAPIDEFSLVVKPAFWQTSIFKILAALLIGAAIALLVQQYNKTRYRKQLRQLEMQKELQQERNRISRDLHDNIGAYTSALIAGINQLTRDDNNKQENIADLNDYASSIMGYLRETIWVLNNQRLTFTAFADRFKNYAGRILKNYPQVSLHFGEHIEKERELTPQVSLNLFRVMQEALQNACRHAEASVVKISFTSTHRIQIDIADNGTGMKGEKREDSYGLQNMKERANEIGFDLTIRSKTGAGTTIVLTGK